MLIIWQLYFLKNFRKYNVSICAHCHVPSTTRCHISMHILIALLHACSISIEESINCCAIGELIIWVTKMKLTIQHRCGHDIAWWKILTNYVKNDVKDKSMHLCMCMCLHAHVFPPFYWPSFEIRVSILLFVSIANSTIWRQACMNMIWIFQQKRRYGNK